jgi:hypothetical protein
MSATHFLLTITVILVIALIPILSCFPSTTISLSTPVQKPVINSFIANPLSISTGEYSTLSWTVTGATTVSIDPGIGSVALTGTRAVSPSRTDIYALTAKNDAGSTRATVEVIVDGAPFVPTIVPPPIPTPPTPLPAPDIPPPMGSPVINYFKANPTSIVIDSSTTLSWSVSNATSVTIDPGIGVVNPVDSLVVSPTRTTTYTLTATNFVQGNYYGSCSETVTITVVLKGEPISPLQNPLQ